ncbi:inositol monophosphatase family protein [Caballeronia sp. LZ028]|uniref:inositol monophosphatase family protein n=1 Tax=Caballeronia sp. LZ028 TaxID=3038563 RepID=UPI002869F057|nr:inositol monophosphatase family protein [Caballeronia sp. LZ028]
MDPIDGTKSFVTGLPLFGTLVAVLENRRPVCGMIEVSAMRERWIGGVNHTSRSFSGNVGMTILPSVSALDNVRWRSQCEPLEDLGTHERARWHHATDALAGRSTCSAIHLTSAIYFLAGRF